MANDDDGIKLEFVPVSMSEPDPEMLRASGTSNHQESDGLVSSSSGAADVAITMPSGDGHISAAPMDLPGADGDEERHAVTQFFTIAFKALAIGLYLIASLLSLSFIMSFVLVVLLLAADFWTVKNVSGRQLVGLRWWNEVKEDGSSEWIFESAPADARIHPSDSRVFWWSLYITPAVWLLLSITALLSLSISWLLLTATAIVLSSANMIGYFKCNRDAKKKIQGGIRNFVASQLIS